ncbi:uncharacterized protein ACN2A1_002611 isoform 1-T5 [Glossina fuscipes fuscipes]
MRKDQCSEIKKIGQKLEDESERNKLTKSFYSGHKSNQPPSDSFNAGLSDCEKSEISPKISEEIAKLNLVQKAINLSTKTESSTSDQQKPENKSQRNESAIKKDYDDEQNPKNESRCNESSTKANYELKGEQKPRKPCAIF